MIFAAQIVFFISLTAMIMSYPGLALFELITRKLQIKWKQSNNYFPSVTIVIAAYNEQDYIKQKIDNCLSLDYPANKLNILVLSDNSNDKTDSIVASFSDNRLSLINHHVRMGKTRLLNRTIGKLCSDIVVFTDANVLFNRSSLMSFVRWFNDDRIGLVCGFEQRIVPSNANAIRTESTYRNFEVRVKELQSRFGSVLGAHGGIYALRRSLWINLPENSIGDDLMTGLNVIKQKRAVIFDRDAAAIEYTGISLKNEFHRRIRIGICNYQSLWWHRWLLFPWHGWPSLFLWLHKIPRWFAPQLMIFIFVSNFYLIQSNAIYLSTFFVQLLFYITAIAALPLALSGRKGGWLLAPTHFCAMNCALMVGFYRWLRGVHSSTWTPSDRT